jgi:hypothetical protein
MAHGDLVWDPFPMADDTILEWRTTGAEYLPARYSHSRYHSTGNIVVNVAHRMLLYNGIYADATSDPTALPFGR